MRIHTFLAFAVAMTCATAAGRAADVPDDVQKTITAAYALNCTAVMDPTDANLDAAFAVMTPDFTASDPKGKTHDRAEVIANGKQQMKQLHATSCTDTPTSFTQSDPNTIVVMATTKIAGDLQAPDGKHDLDFTDKAQDTWKLVSGKWMQASSKDLHVLVKIDGNVAQDEGGS